MSFPTPFPVLAEDAQGQLGGAMFERRVIHAIQHTNEKEFHLRYRTYNSQAARDEVFDAIKETHKDISRVTLTVTAESHEQLSLEM